jgi:hypothetical protein
MKNKLEGYSGFLAWFIALLLVALAAGCGGGGGRDPILGTPGVGILGPPAVPDTTRPSVTFTVPADAAANVPTNAAITALFSEEMAPASITAPGTFTVTCVAGQEVACVSPAGAVVTYVPGSRTAVFTLAPASPLTAGANYTATVSAAATDLAGNALIVPAAGGLPVPNPWTFATTISVGDTTPPVVNLTFPADGAANVTVAQTISATFNETMNAASVVNAFTLTGPATGPGAGPVAGLVIYNPVTSIATFNPTANLTPGVTYTARIAPTATDLAGNALVVPAVGGLPVPNPWTFSIPTVPPPPPPVVNLGSAAPFGAFGGPAGITNQGLLTVINGDIGTTGASTLITGFHDAGVGCTYTETPLNAGIVNGTIFTAAPPPTPACATEGTAVTAAIAAQALLDAQTAFNTLAGLPNGIDVGTAGAAGPGELGGRTLAPGVYKSAPGTYGITLGDLTLDAQGDANASWVFQMGTSLTVGIAGPAGARSVILINGAQAKNVFWQVGSSATINAAGGGTMVGTIISSAATTFSTAGVAAITTLNGRAMALAASVTMVNTHINVPAP